jgi:hypothetical protein
MEEFVRDEFVLNERMPGLSEILNLKFRYENKDLYEKIFAIVQHAQKLESILKFKDGEIERLKYMIKYLTMGNSNYFCFFLNKIS